MDVDLTETHISSYQRGSDTESQSFNPDASSDFTVELTGKEWPVDVDVSMVVSSTPRIREESDKEIR